VSSPYQARVTNNILVKPKNERIFEEELCFAAVGFSDKMTCYVFHPKLDIFKNQISSLNEHNLNVLYQQFTLWFFYLTLKLGNREIINYAQLVGLLYTIFDINESRYEDFEKSMSSSTNDFFEWWRSLCNIIGADPSSKFTEFSAIATNAYKEVLSMCKELQTFLETEKNISTAVEETRSAQIIDVKDIEKSVCSSLNDAEKAKGFIFKLPHNSGMLLKYSLIGPDNWEIRCVNADDGREGVLGQNYNSQQTIATLYFLVEQDMLKQEGATDDDVKWWSSLSDDVKQKLIKDDNTFRWEHFTICVQKLHLSAEDALRKTWLDFPVYGKYPLTQEILEEMNGLGFTEDDKPLPYELHNRVDRFMAKSMFKMKEIQEEKGHFSTMNAFFRSKIRSGDL